MSDEESKQDMSNEQTEQETSSEQAKPKARYAFMATYGDEKFWLTGDSCEDLKSAA